MGRLSTPRLFRWRSKVIPGRSQGSAAARGKVHTCWYAKEIRYILHTWYIVFTKLLGAKSIHAGMIIDVPVYQETLAEFLNLVILANSVMIAN